MPRVEQDHLRGKRLRRFQGLQAVVRRSHIVPGQTQLQRQRLGGVAVVVGDQDPARTYLRRPLRITGRQCDDRGLHADHRQPDASSVPLPSPSLLAVTTPPCISTRRRTSVEPDAQPPCARSERLSTCDEQVEDLRAAGRAGCPCRSRAR